MFAMETIHATYVYYYVNNVRRFGDQMNCLEPNKYASKAAS